MDNDYSEIHVYLFFDRMNNQLADFPMDIHYVNDFSMMVFQIEIERSI